MQKKVVYIGLYGLLVALAIGLGVWNGSPSLVGFSIFDVSSQSQFDNGVYENVSYNGTGVMLVGSNLSGAYTSGVLSAGQFAHWNNFTWGYIGTSPYFMVRSCDDDACINDPWNQILLDAPSILALENASYFQYRALFSRSSASSESTLTSVSVDYTPYNHAPVIQIDSPQEGATYNYNSSLSLNVSVHDANLSSCWYTINGGAAADLPGCANTSIDVPFGTLTLTVFANDSYGLTSSESVEFTTFDLAPTLVIVGPVDHAATNASVQNFSYYVNGTNLSGCELTTDFSGAWLTTASNTDPEEGVTSFSIPLEGTGNRLWSLDCFNTGGIRSAADNRTLIVDPVAPVISLDSPRGTYTSRKAIPVELSVDDSSAVTCIYSVSKVGAGTILVVVMPQCSSTSFNVGEQGTYQLAVTVTDAAGNTGVTTSSFTVDASSQPGSSSSGSNDGVSVNIEDLVLPRLSHGTIPSIRLRGGFSANYTIDLVNSGNAFLNGCTLSGSGTYASWIASSDEHSISSSERIPYTFSVSVPRDASPGETDVEMLASCAETEIVVPLTVDVVPAEFAFETSSYARIGTRLSLNYSIEDLTGEDSTVALTYSLVKNGAVTVTEGSESIALSANELVFKTLSFELPKDTVGEFDLVLTLSTTADEIIVHVPVFLSGSEVTGLVISDANKRTLTLWGGIALGVLFIGGLLYFLRRRYLATHPSTQF